MKYITDKLKALKKNQDYLKYVEDVISEKDNLTVPEVRALLTNIALDQNLEILNIIAKKMYRRKPKYPVAKAKRQSLSPDKAERIRKYKALHPEMSNRDIGERFGVDGGRVSEAIHKVFGY